MFSIYWFSLYQENLCKANALQRTQHASDVVSLLSEIRISSGKNDWTGIRTANIPAVIDSATAASGAKKEVSEGFILEVLSTAVVSATVKCNHAGEIAGMRRLYNSIGGFQMGILPLSSAFGFGPQQTNTEKESFNMVLLMKFVHLLQQFVGTAEKGLLVDKSLFRETCSQATALLLSHMVCISFLDRCLKLSFVLSLFQRVFCQCVHVCIHLYTYQSITSVSLYNLFSYIPLKVQFFTKCPNLE